MNFSLLSCKTRFRAVPLRWLLRMGEGVCEEHQISLLPGEMPALRAQASLSHPPLPEGPWAWGKAHGSCVPNSLNLISP